MHGDHIKHLEELLRDHLGATKTIVDSKSTRLTAPGENYGATMIKLDVTLKNQDNDTEELHTVAKLIPEEEFYRKLFHIQVSCKVEIAFYDTIVPALQKFQRARGVQKVVDFFPKMYASRINLDGSDIVDENAVLLMENLQVQGYQNVNRLESFDLATIKLVLKNLAAFHAVPLALKLHEPEIFATKIMPYIGIDFPPPPKKDRAETSDDVVYNMFKDDEECKSLLPLLEKNPQEPRTSIPRAVIRNEPYVTMGHGDLWVNNIMVKFEQGKPVDVKFVDFQNPTYTSPAADLFFLLWTSVKDEVLEQHFDELIRFYYDNFIENLKQTKTDTARYSLEGFLEEMKAACKNETKHVMFFTTVVIFYDRKSVVKYKSPPERKAEDIPHLARKRVILMVKTCESKGWLSLKTK